MFGNREKNVAEEQAAKAEADPLLAAPVAELAAAIMPAFGPAGQTTHRNGLNILQLSASLMSSYPRGAKYLRELLDPTGEGVQMLEHAGLVQQRILGTGGGCWRVTRLGEAALAEGSVERYLAQVAPPV